MRKVLFTLLALMLVGLGFAQSPKTPKHPSIEQLLNQSLFPRQFTGIGDWDDEENWASGTLPSEGDTVVIVPGAKCWMNDVFDEDNPVPYKIYIIDNDSIEKPLKRCGQLFLPQDAEVQATFMKKIRGWKKPYVEYDQNGNWYLVSFPTNVDKLSDTLYIPDFRGAGMITGGNSYDLYFFKTWWKYSDSDQGQQPVAYEDEWRNYRYYLPGTNVDMDGETVTLQDFKAEYNGYLYANYNDVDLHFTGDLYTQPYKEYQLTAESDGYDVKQNGVHLVGNPYPSNAKIDYDTSNDIDIEGLYMMNPDRDDVVC